MASKATSSGTTANDIVIRPATYDDIDTLQDLETSARSTFLKRNENLREIAEQGPYTRTGHVWAIDHALTFVAVMNVSQNSTNEDERNDTDRDTDDDRDSDNDEDGGEDDEDAEPGEDQMELSTRTPRSNRYNLRSGKDETNKRRRTPSPEHKPNKKRNTMTRTPGQLRLGSLEKLQRHEMCKRHSTISELMDRVEIGSKGAHGRPTSESPKADAGYISRASPPKLTFESRSLQTSSAGLRSPTSGKIDVSFGSSSSLSSLNSEELGNLENQVIVGMGMVFSRQDPPCPSLGPDIPHPSDGMDTDMEGMATQPSQASEAQAVPPDNTESNNTETLVGFLIAVPMRSRTGGTVIHVELLMVPPEHQQKGVGGKLLRTIIDVVDRDIPEPFNSKLSLAQRRRLGHWRRKRLSLLTYDVPWGTQFYERNEFKKVPHKHGLGPEEMPRKLKNNLDFHHLNILAADSRPEGSDTVPESALWCLVRNWRGR